MKEYWVETLLGGGGLAGLAALVRWLRSAAGRAVISRLRSSRTCEEIREALETLSSVVSAQGEALEWLRAELDSARKELAVAKAALEAEKTKLEADNSKLRKRVAELEAQVKALEAALASRTRRNTTKKEVK